MCSAAGLVGQMHCVTLQKGSLSHEALSMVIGSAPETPTAPVSPVPGLGIDGPWCCLGVQGWALRRCRPACAVA